MFVLIVYFVFNTIAGMTYFDVEQIGYFDNKQSCEATIKKLPKNSLIGPNMVHKTAECIEISKEIK